MTPFHHRRDRGLVPVLLAGLAGGAWWGATLAWWPWGAVWATLGLVGLIVLAAALTPPPPPS